MESRQVWWQNQRLVWIETFRDPLAVLGNVIIPILCFCFFVLPNQEVLKSQSASTESTLQLTSMLVFSTCLFGFSLAVAQDREKGFGKYLRSLPASPRPRILAQACSALGIASVGILLLWLLALFTSQFNLNLDLLKAGLALVLTMLMWGFLGAALGQFLGTKAVVTIAQLLFLVLSFAGGMLISPSYLPEGLDKLSRFLPTRAARDIVCHIGLGQSVSKEIIIVALVWTLTFVVLYVIGVRRAGKIVE